MTKKRTVQSVLEQILRVHVSEVAPVPATAEQETALATFLGAVPADLAALYRVAANPDVALPPADYDWLSLDDALGVTAALRKDFEGAESLLAIAHDPGGDLPCFDCATGRIVYWDHERAAPSKLEPNLAAFLARALAEAKELAGDRAAATAAAALRDERAGARARAFPVRPKKLAEEPNAVVRQHGRDGSNALVFLETTRRLASGWQASTTLREDGSDVERVVDAAGLTLAYDAGSSRLLAAGRGELSVTDTRAEGAELDWKPNRSLLWPTTRIRTRLDHRVAIAPGGQLAASASWEGVVAIWSMNDWPKLATPADLASARALEPDALEAGRPLRTMQHPKLVQRLRFSPDAELVATLSEDDVFLSDVATGDARASWKGESMWGIDFSADGARVYVGSHVETDNVRVFERGGKQIAAWTAPHPVVDVRLTSPNVLATLGLEQLTLHDAETGAVLCKTKRKRKKSDIWSQSVIADVRDDTILTLHPAAVFRVA